MSLYLLHCSPDPRALTVWATRHRLLSPDGDLGYAIHAVLRAAFGDLAPKPFRYLGAKQGLLGYTDQPLSALRESAALAPPDIAQALGLETLAARPFPEVWRQDQALGFEVRVRPVLRAKDGRERDVFLHAVESAASSTRDANREAIYADWLGKRFTEHSAARLALVAVESFRLSRVIRRSAADASGRRGVRTIMGPDVVLKGRLQVENSDTFTQILRRGIGRHRAFGFGMVLLKPARSC
ncbi:type I-E CRISPR-associated protein Cas6/Cse3/CasE [Marichromatium gracile]|uniref:type I-E CRISPR-associated protein Cas6/Cse3/CasE n=1 Tax=Marichromatium gracile TaxID=1048 RepID=UPI0009EE5BF5|nr:type I-E CRISPR-associated protein Cas6/Cse3/CasE [Marichromatium gracile]